jgi:hypothetical protein
MGLFSRKTDKEIIAEGKDLFYKGDFAGADKKLMKLAIKGNDEACYWVGRISVETGAKHHDRKRIDIGRSFLEKAAKKGNIDACAYLERYFDVPNPYAEKEEKIFVKEVETTVKEDKKPEFCGINIATKNPEEAAEQDPNGYVMSFNAVRVLDCLKRNRDKDLTAKEIAVALNLESRQIDGLFTSAFVRKGLGERVPDGAKKYLKLTPEGLSYKP